MAATVEGRERIANRLSDAAYDDEMYAPFDILKRVLGLNDSDSTRSVFLVLEGLIRPGVCAWEEVDNVPRVYRTACGHVVDADGLRKVAYCPCCGGAVAIFGKED